MYAIRRRLNLLRAFPALVLSFVIQACLASSSVGSPIGGSPPPMDPPFDAYDVCIRSIPALPIWEVSQLKDAQRDCFRQTIQVNHMTLPAGTTSDQAFDNYEACLKKDPTISVNVGGLAFNANQQNTARQNCFTSVLK